MSIYIVHHFIIVWVSQPILNTPIFAISRISGWSAHVIEEKFAEAAPKPALYRPKAVYVGKYCGPMGCEYTPMKKRKP